MANFEPITGDVFQIQNGRLCVVANSITLDSLVLYSILPVSSAIFMCGEDDFIVLDEIVFKKQTVMLENWNCMAVPIEFFKTTRTKGKLSDKYIQYLSSYIYFKMQNSKNNNLTILTGPPIVSNSDIRWLFRQMETKEFHELRTSLVSVAK